MLGTEEAGYHLAPAHPREDPFFVPAFPATYMRFVTLGQLLDLLLFRCVPGGTLTPGWLLRMPCTVVCPNNER